MSRLGYGSVPPNPHPDPGLLPSTRPPGAGRARSGGAGRLPGDAPGALPAGVIKKFLGPMGRASRSLGGGLSMRALPRKAPGTSGWDPFTVATPGVVLSPRPGPLRARAARAARAGEAAATSSPAARVLGRLRPWALGELGAVAWEGAAASVQRRHRQKHRQNGAPSERCARGETAAGRTGKESGSDGPEIQIPILFLSQKDAAHLLPRMLLSRRDPRPGARPGVIPVVYFRDSAVRESGPSE